MPIIKPLEDRHEQVPVSDLEDARAVVVLAGGSYDGLPDVDGPGQNSESSTVSLVTGLRLQGRCIYQSCIRAAVFVITRIRKRISGIVL